MKLLNFSYSIMVTFAGRNKKPKKIIVIKIVRTKINGRLRMSIV